MNIKVNVGIGGGIFSKLMLVFQNIDILCDKNISKLLDINNIEILFTDSRYSNNTKLFDFIYNQHEFALYDILNCDGLRPYCKEIPLDDMNRMKIIKSKLTFQNNFKTKFESIRNKINVNEKCLGVHIRLTDMHLYHPEFGIFNFNDFVNKINEELNEYDYEKIFIASDNNESIKKLIEIYGDKIIYYQDSFRSEKEIDGTSSNFDNSKLWEDSFIEMLLLSECGTLIHRISNLPNFSKIYSNTLNKIIVL